MRVGPVTCSFGAAAFLPGLLDEAEAMIAAADAALYEAKAMGRNAVVLASSAGRPDDIDLSISAD